MMAAPKPAQEQEPAQAVVEEAAAVVLVAATVPLAGQLAESVAPDVEQPAPLFSSRERAEEEAEVAALSVSFSLRPEAPEQAVPDRRSSFPLAARPVTVRPAPEPRWIPQSPSVPVPLRSAPCSCEKR